MSRNAKRFRSLMTALVLAVMAGAPRSLSAADDGAHQIPVPTAAALVDAKKAVAEVYGDDIARAVTTEKKKGILARLLTAAAQEKTDRSAEYAILDRARDVAESTNDLSATADVIDLIARDFQIDPLKQKLDAAVAISRQIHLAGEQKLFVPAAGVIVDQAIAADQYETAASIANVAMSVARQTRDPKLVQDAQSQLSQVAELKTGYGKARAAEAVLASTPDDPDANLIAGRFRCFVKADWERGLPELSKCPDAKLKAAATTDVKADGAPEAVSIAADLWWEIGAAEAPAYRRSIRIHAGSLYRNAAPALTGLSKVKAEKRLAELDQLLAADPHGPPVIDVLSDSSLFTTRGKLTRAGDDLKLDRESALTTVKPIAVPFKATFVVATTETNIRIWYGRELVILNWESRPDVLRLADPVSGDIRSFDGKGRVDANTFVRVDLTVTKDKCDVAVDGQSRATLTGDYSKCSEKLGLFSKGSPLALRSFKIGTP